VFIPKCRRKSLRRYESGLDGQGRHINVINNAPVLFYGGDGNRVALRPQEDRLALDAVMQQRICNTSPTRHGPTAGPTAMTND
jgi:hypothetical protein